MAFSYIFLNAYDIYTLYLINFSQKIMSTNSINLFRLMLMWHVHVQRASNNWQLDWVHLWKFYQIIIVTLVINIINTHIIL